MEAALWFFGLIITFAGAVRSGIYLWSKIAEGFDGAVEHKRVQGVLSDMASEEGWPNGATSMKESHWDIYEKVSSIDLRISELQRTVEDQHEWDRSSP